MSRTPTLRGVPVVRPRTAPARGRDCCQFGRVRELLERARARFAPGCSHAFRRSAGAPDLRTRRDGTSPTFAGCLIERWDVDPRDADWLLANRYERHDATLPMLPPDARNSTCVATSSPPPRRGAGRASTHGAAPATARVLRSMGGCGSYIGIDIDARTIEYAQRFSDGAVVRFQVGSRHADRTPDRQCRPAHEFRDHRARAGPARFRAGGCVLRARAACSCSARPTMEG